ncbi:MAG TPA: alkaline phosphatase [Bacteroidales bacterium]|nr:alkaline phosphatase [Bacteroidales bacterium]
MKSKLILLAVLILLSQIALPSGFQKGETRNKPKHPKNIILMIGDGMGTAQLYAGITALRDNTNIERCPVSGFVKTLSASNYITDSAAGATAYAIGCKTTNGFLSETPDSIPKPTILEMAEKKGLATGLVATSAITHATPAAFIAHVSSRGSYEQIAAQFLNTDIDVFIGGGWKYFTKRADGRNLADSLLKHNYVIARSLEEVEKASGPKLAGLLSDEHMPRYSEGRGDMLPLSTEKAINILSGNKKGFFMMVEGSQIDWGGHANDLNYIVEEVVDFDKAIGKALDFAAQDGETLVIITADHETGGMAITGGDMSLGKVEAKFTTGDHSAVMVPLFAFGPGSERFSGIQDNTDVFKKCVELLQLSDGK